MQQIADKLGISKVSVHRAIKGIKGNSGTLDALILKTAKEIGYVYNLSRLFKGRNFLFLAKRLYFLNDREMFYTQIFKELEGQCKERGANLILQFYETSEDKNAVRNIVSADQKLAGIFVTGQFPGDDMISFTRFPLPIVVIDFFSPIYNLSYVYLPSYFDSYRLVHYAYSKGHRNIGYVGHITEATNLYDRFAGFRRAVAELHLPYVRDWMHTNKSDNNEIFSEPLSEKLPTVYICYCDLMARKLIHALKFKKLRVPDDISILSFDNTEIYDNSITYPHITSLGLDKMEFASASLSLMQEQLENPEIKKSVELTSRIFERDTVKDIKNNREFNEFSPH